MKLPRRSLRYLSGLLLGAGLLLAGAKMYLSSGRAAEQVASKLNTLLGVPVSVGSVDIGLSGGSAVRGLQVFESEEGRPEEPWVTVGEIDTQASAFDLMSGGTIPGQLQARDTRLDLRFDPHGHLLTRLPKPKGGAPIPPVHVEQGQVTLNQEGHPPFVVTGVTADLTGTDGGFHFEGTVSDPTWGDWTAAGDVTSDGTFQLTLKTPHAVVTQDKLKALPFVPAKVWKEVELEGITPVDLTVKVSRSPSGGSDATYRVEMDPRDTRVVVTSIDLHADQAHGHVVVADERVELRGVHGRASEGALGVDGDLDFHREPSRLQFAIRAEGLQISKLPEAWRMPSFLRFDGRLSGRANLVLTIGGGKVRPEGNGEGEITDARVFGVPVPKPIPIELFAEGDGFRWDHAKAKASTPPPPAQPARGDEPAAIAPAPQAAAVPPADGSPSLLAWAARGVLAVPAGFVDAGTSALAAVPRRIQPRDPAQKPRTAEAKLAVSDIDLAELARNLQLDLPVALAGRLSFDATLTVPLDTATDLKAYQVRGTAGVSDLRVAGLAFDQVNAKVRYEQGVLHLDDLRGRVDAPKAPGKPASVGTVEGGASYRVVPAGDLDLNLKVKEVDLGALTKLTPTLPVRVEGPVSGTFDGKVTGGKAPLWDLNLDLTSPRLKLQGIPAQRVRGSLGYHGDAAEYKLEGESLGGKFKLEGKLPPGRAGGVNPPIPDNNQGVNTPRSPSEPDGRLTVERVRLSQLVEALGLQGVLGPLRGAVSLDLPFRHDGPDRRPVGRGRFRIADIRWGEEELSVGLQGEVRLMAGELRFRDVTGSIGEGLLRGSVAFDLRKPDRGRFSLFLEGVEAGRLLVPFPSVAASVQGSVTATLRGTLGRQWDGSGQVALTRGKVFGVEVSEWRLPVDFHFEPGSGIGRLDASDVQARIAQGRAQGRASLRWGGATRLEGTLRFFNADWRGLFKSYESVGGLGAGMLTGRLDFGSDDLHGVDDLKATLDATLGPNQALQLPVLQQLTPFLAPSSTTRFQQGDVHARLAGGVVRVQRLALVSSLLQVFVEGTITLRGGLDLDVVANTGSLAFSAAILPQLGLTQLPTTGVLPTSLLTQASTLLSRRVIHLHVGGTVRSPSVRFNPVLLLTEEAVRFFLVPSGLPLP
jgi:hypothetical protein